LTQAEITTPISPPAEARCLGCGYQLRGLNDPRCPECGRDFNPADVMTMDLPVRRRRVRRSRLLKWLPTVAWALACCALSKLLMWWLEPVYAVPLPLLIPGVLVAGAARRWTRRRILAGHREPQRRSEQVFRAAGYAFAIVVTIGAYKSDICPHAIYYEVSPVGIARNHPNDPHGAGPCGNHATWSCHVVGPWYVYHW
jgi:hypothetical protein